MQSDPLTMVMHAFAVVPLIQELRTAVREANQVWFADDAIAVGRLQALLSWWQVLSTQGPGFGYFPNALKTVLIVKPHLFSVANSLFSGTKVQITERGQRHLGAAPGSQDFCLCV